MVFWVSFATFICGGRNAYAQNTNILEKDSILIDFLLNYTPKDTQNKHAFVLKFYNKGSVLGKFKGTKNRTNKIEIDTFVFFEPFTRDSLLHSTSLMRAELVNADTIAADTPVVKSTLILPIKKEGALSAMDTFDLFKALKRDKQFNITFTNETEWGNNFYNGLTNTQNPRIVNYVDVDTKILGIPISFGTTYTNFRTDNSLNVLDFRLSVDVLKFKNDLYNNKRINSKELSSLNYRKELNRIQTQQLDSQINQLELEVNNPYYVEQYQLNKKMEEMRKADTNTWNNKIDLNKRKQIQYDIDKYEKERARIEKLKQLRELQKKELLDLDNQINLEQSNLLSSKSLRDNLGKKSPALKKGFGWMYSLNRLDIGRIAPIYSELTLNGLSYLGINTSLNINRVELSATIGRLNNFASYLSNINSNLGGYVYGLKLNKKANNANRFISLLYLNPSNSSPGEQATLKYIVLGVGENRKISNAIHFLWEIAYSETDSSAKNRQSNNKLFQQFDPYALALQAGFNGNIGTKTTFEIGSKYTGFNFKNPANFNLRNDFLRNHLKITHQFKQNKMLLSYQIKYDVDNFTGIKAATTNIINNNVVYSYRINKQWKTITSINHTNVTNRLEGSQFPSQLYHFTSTFLNQSVIHNYKAKKAFFTHIFNTTYNQTTNNQSDTNNNYLHQSTFNSLVDLHQLKLKVNSTLGYQLSKSDPRSGYQAALDLVKDINIFQIGMGFSLRGNENLYNYKSVNSILTLRKGRIFFLMSAEYYLVEDILREQPVNQSGLILKTVLTIKI
jgi:hypothetical protein